MAVTLHPLTMYDSLREVYLSYYDTAFRIREESVQAERRHAHQRLLAALVWAAHPA